MRAILTSFSPADFQSAPAPVLSVPTVRKQTLEGLVTTSIRDAFGDPVVAASLMEARVRDNKTLLAQLLAPYLADACWKAVTRRLGETKDPDIEENPYEAPDTSKRLHALADSLLDFKLPSGILLRDAFSKDLQEAASWYDARAKAFANRSRWLNAVSVLVPRGSTVGDVIDAGTLRTLLDDS